MATRTLAEYLGTDLEIYTGAWGVLELNNVKAKPVEVYLGLTVQERVVPAPAVTWKVGGVSAHSFSFLFGDNDKTWSIRKRYCGR